MAKSSQEFSTKRIAISKANAQMVAVVSVAAFISVFCLFASKAVWSQNSYQSRVVDAKEEALKQLKFNVKEFDTLRRQYSVFDNAPVNIISGVKDGPSDRDGSNSKIVIDALPSNYNFPAMTASLEKILTDAKLKIGSITGTDDQVNQLSVSKSGDPKVVSMPFTFNVTETNYAGVQELITKLNQSIRPIQIDLITFSGGQDSMTITVNAHTYYQPTKTVKITKKVVK